MTAIEMLILRFKKKPNNFSYSELKKLLRPFGYAEKQGSGSRVIFVNSETGHKIKLHKPHPKTILKRYQLDLIEKELLQKDLL